jgi:hypothetical protein
VEGMPELKNQVGTELKYGIRIDTLIAQGAIRPPNLIKIDTDGIEYQIVSGMKNLLLSESRPNSIQIEVQVGEREKLYELMQEVGYSEVSHHANGKAEAMLKKGVSLDKVAYNAIFEPLG